MMRDLSRIHGGQETWITRGQMWAMVIATLAIALLAFFLGMNFGRTSWTRAEPEVRPAGVITAEMEVDALDDLLARVEAAQEGTSQRLTFPGTLPKGAMAAPPTGEAGIEPSLETLVPAGRRAPEPPAAATSGDVPDGGWAVQLASFMSESEADALVGELEAAGFDAYRMAGLVEGVTRHRVRVGGFSNQERAVQGRDRIALEGRYEDAIVVRAP